jgi:methylase of polypeptide subunit release factors
MLHYLTERAETPPGYTLGHRGMIQEASVSSYTRFPYLLWFLRRPFIRRRLRRPVIERVNGVPLIVLPQVLNPVVFRTGELLARAIAESGFAEPPEAAAGAPPPLALDMGTGSGIGAIFLARRGYKVIGVDISAEAVRCAEINILLNRLEDRVEIRQGDLFAPVRDHRFQLVTFNPPFLRGEPTSLYDQGWRATDVMERFAAGLPGALSPNGGALVLLSTDGDEAGMLNALNKQGLSINTLARRNLGNEVITIYGVRRNS